MGTIHEEYKRKLITAEQAANMVKSGDILSYGLAILFPASFDAALGERAADESLSDVAIFNGGNGRIPEVFAKDTEGKTFFSLSTFFSPIDRLLIAKGSKNITYIPNQLHEWPRMRDETYQPFFKSNVICLTTCEMDQHGNFNFGLGANDMAAQIRASDLVIVEVNKKLPYVLGGANESVNIRNVDYIIESDQPIVMLPPTSPPTEEETKIAHNIVPFIKDGACLQLGIGGIPDAIGNVLVNSDLKDLGISTEMFSNCMVDLHESGKVTNQRKRRDRGRTTFAFCMGSKRTYDFLNHNPEVAAYDVEYTNTIGNIASEDNMVSVNGMIAIDLFSQVSSESDGFNQISGAGGQVEFHMGAFDSKGGVAVLTNTSTYTDGKGVTHSRIRPTLKPGTIVSTPRQCVHYVATEYGIVNLKGRSIWGRAEQLINIAHPDFRDQLLKEANDLGIWSPSNKIPF